MSCKFSVPFSTSADEIIARAKSAITGAGGNFNNESTSGTFSLPIPMGKIEGQYAKADSSLIITISHKPVFISCHLIEQKLKEYLLPAV